MVPPIDKFYVDAGLYDEEAGVCRLPETLVCQAPADSISEDSVSDKGSSSYSLSRLAYEAFGRPNTAPRSSIWDTNPLKMSGWSLLAGLPGCSGDPEEAPVLGDPIAFVESLGGETTLNSQPILGNIDGIGLSGDGSNSSVVWSAFDGTHPENTGTFAFLRSGSTGGSQATVSSDASSKHLDTSGAVLSNGQTAVIYSKTTGDEDPSSLVVQRVNASGAPEGPEIQILAPSLRTSIPSGQILALDNGFVVVYRDGEGQLAAKTYDLTGHEVASNPSLGAEPRSYSLARGDGDHWVLAEINPPNQIHVRSFEGINSGGVDTNIHTSAFPSDPDISVAMQETGNIMVAWNAQSGSGTSLDERIEGATLGASGSITEGPFTIRSSQLAHTLALASDHRGNFVFAWEEGNEGHRSINARIYDGSSHFITPADFSSISNGDNSNVYASVSTDGVLSFVYDKSTTTSGTTSHSITRRDYRITYE